MDNTSIRAVGKARADVLDQLDAVARAQGQVNEHEVRDAAALDERDGLVPIVRFAAHDQVGLTVDDLRETLAEDRVVVHQEEPVADGPGRLRGGGGRRRGGAASGGSITGRGRWG